MHCRYIGHKGLCSMHRASNVSGIIGIILDVDKHVVVVAPLFTSRGRATVVLRCSHARAHIR
jgi:hypothetical protein